MTPGDELAVDITGVDDDGAGVGAAPGFPVHVAGALPGEAIRARIGHISIHGGDAPGERRAWASLLRIDRVSPDRVAPSCRAYGDCGGCVLQHWRPDAQLAWKERMLRARVAAAAELAAVPVAPAVASPLALGYRNNSKLVAARDRGGRLVLGGYAPRSHDVVDLAGCAVVEPALERAAVVLRDVLEEAGVEPYDERRLTGVLRYAILRANAEGHVLATLVTASDAFAAGNTIADRLQTRLPAVTGVIQNVNGTRGNVLYGDHDRTLAGVPFLEDRIGAVRLRLSSRAFFQANRQVAALAYQAIASAAAVTSADRVVDAYAGVGGIALTLAPTAARVWAIEDHAAAADDAAIAARLNGVDNATFVAGDAADRLADLQRSEGRVEVIVLNPPRRGCAPQVLHHTAALRPRRVAYLSCSPPTLLRDLGHLATLGYRTVGITPFDMLPHTPHLEALAILEPE